MYLIHRLDIKTEENLLIFQLDSDSFCFRKNDLLLVSKESSVKGNYTYFLDRKLRIVTDKQSNILGVVTAYIRGGGLNKI